MVEALFQNVLGYPRLPVRVHHYIKHLDLDTEIGQLTATVEKLTEQYGKELALYYIRRTPEILCYDYDTLAARAEQVRSMLDLRPAELLMILRKNPHLLCLEPQVARSRYNQLHKVTPLNHDSVKKMVRKYPLALNFDTQNVEDIVDRLRQLCNTRVLWQENFDTISFSLLAFFLRDWKDKLARLEFLIVTGEGTSFTLTQVFKPSDNLFCKRYRDFRPWLKARRAKQAQQRQQMQQAGQHVPQQKAQSWPKQQQQSKRRSGSRDGQQASSTAA